MRLAIFTLFVAGMLGGAVAAHADVLGIGTIGNVQASGGQADATVAFDAVSRTLQGLQVNLGQSVGSVAVHATQNGGAVDGSFAATPADLFGGSLKGSAVCADPGCGGDIYFSGDVTDLVAKSTTHVPSSGYVWIFDGRVNAASGTGRVAIEGAVTHGVTPGAPGIPGAFISGQFYDPVTDHDDVALGLRLTFLSGVSAAGDAWFLPRRLVDADPSPGDELVPEAGFFEAATTATVTPPALYRVCVDTSQITSARDDATRMRLARRREADGVLLVGASATTLTTASKLSVCGQFDDLGVFGVVLVPTTTTTTTLPGEGSTTTTTTLPGGGGGATTTTRPPVGGPTTTIPHVCKTLARCRFDQAVAEGRCSGQQYPGLLGRRVRRTAKLLDGLDNATTKQRKRTGKAMAGLIAQTKRIQRRTKPGKVSAGCAGQIESVLEGLQSDLRL